MNTIEALHATLDAMQDNNVTEYNTLYTMPGDEGKQKKFCSKTKCTQYSSVRPACVPTARECECSSKTMCTQYLSQCESLRGIFGNVYHKSNEVTKADKTRRKISPIYTD